MPKPPQPPKPITLSTNCVIGAEFYWRGAALPFERVEDLPENLRQYVVTGTPEEEDEWEPGAPRANYQLGEIYRVTDDDRLGRKLQRQVAQMEAQEAEADWIEEVASAELPTEIMQDLTAQHEAEVELEKAQLAAADRHADEVSEAARASLEPVQMYVRRGGRHYVPTGSARLKPSEPVFIRRADGQFSFHGETSGDSSPELPDPPTTTIL